MKEGRIAVPSVAPGGLDSERSEHFGHCEVFTLVDVKEGHIEGVTTLPNPPHMLGGCMLTVNILAQKGVNAVIVGGIGRGPLEGLRKGQTQIYFGGNATKVRDAVETLLQGKMPILSDAQVCTGEHHH